MSDKLFEGTEAREVLLRCGIRAVQATPLLGSGGDIVGMLSTHFRSCRNPSDRALRYLDLLAGRAAILVERMKMLETQRRVEKLTALTQLANTLAHEINNPVQALTNILALLSRHEHVLGDAHDLVALGQEQLTRIAENVRQLLSVQTNGFNSESDARKIVESIHSAASTISDKNGGQAS